MPEPKLNIGQISLNMQRLKEELPQKLANQAKNFFTDSFNKQGWEDNGLETWQTPKRRIPGTQEYKYPKNKGLGRRTSATLVRSGRLRRAVNNSIREVSFDSTKLIVDVPYAEYQNYGTDKIPARKFMGNSKALIRKQKDLIIEAMKNVVKLK